MFNIRFVFVVVGVLAISCNSNKKGFVKTSDAKGEIKSILINLTEPTTLSSAYRPKLLNMISVLLDSMDVVIHTYVDAGPTYYST